MSSSRDHSEYPIRTALLGFCIPAMEALHAHNHSFVAVVPEEFTAYMEEHKIPYISWDFGRLNEQSERLAMMLTERGVKVAVPLYEETVEWAGALNGRFRDDPRLFTRYLLFRDKAMMKRRAQMHGIRVGVFEEADNKEDVNRFFKRVNTALTKIEGDVEDPIHLKPLNAAGSMGHKMIRTLADIETLTEKNFPCLLETHLNGQEFSCEVFVHNKKIRFLNITEYIHLGYSNFVPASPTLEKRRKVIKQAVQDLIDAFDIEYGMIHPEFFITPDNKINFGEVAARVPGGHIFELIKKAHGFDPFMGFVLCADPETTEAQLKKFFPKESAADEYAGCLMVYPKQSIITRAKMPSELLVHPYYEKHNLFVPTNPKVAEREAYGNHYGTIYFKGNDPETMRKLLLEYEEVSFYESPERKAEGDNSTW
ncbi:MAG: ATP-grasp domain-containing protein [Deltaproteobacteria bacterium]|nr:MAG: ATP-grasp domain-containing protein [Deltaproteobacteria bacterium]